MSEISSLEHEVIIACSAQDRQKCLDIRLEVFHKEQNFPADIEIDEYDEGDKATHFLLRLTPSLTPIGTIRCAKLAPFTYKLARLAVLKNHRRQKLGRYLVLALHDWVQQHAQAQLDNIDNTDQWIMSSTKSANPATQTPTSCSSYAEVDHPDQDPSSGSNSHTILSSAKIITHSQIPVRGFYARFGYSPEGEQFDEEGEPHQKMVLQLPLR